MPRHRLAALFEPRSLLVLSQRILPLMQAPAPPGAASTFIKLSADTAIVVPERLEGLEAGERLDLALVCVDAERLPEALEAVKPHRPRAAILLYAGDERGHAWEYMVYCRTWARLNDCTILGPASAGIQRPNQGFNLSYMPQLAHAGRLAVVAQSRTLVAAILDWASDLQLGFSSVISMGDEAGIDVASVLDYLATDEQTDGIALYLEDAASARELASALSAAAGVKPVVVLKAGNAMQEPDPAGNAVFDALLRRSGAVRVPYFVQLFSALKVLRHAYRPQGRRIAVFSNGSGAAQLALNVMGPRFAVTRAELSQTTSRTLAGMLDPGAQTLNPVVAASPLSADQAQGILEALVADQGVDGVLALLAPDPLADMESVVRRVAQIASSARKPVISCLMGESNARGLRHLLDDVGTPAFRTPEAAVSAFGVLASYHYNQVLSRQTLPPEALGRPPRVEQARALIVAAQNQRRTVLAAAEAWQLLECFDVPIQGVAEALPHSLYSSGKPAPWPDDEPEMAIRVLRDPRIGPYIMFGAGGANATPANTRAIELPPLNGFLAQQLIERSPIWEQTLSRRLSSAAFEALQEALEQISGLVSELPEIETLTIDPLVGDGGDLYALNVDVNLSPLAVLALPEGTGYQHMAIHPYPRHLVRRRVLADGTQWVMRPIRPEDAEPLQAFVRELSNESRYMRFVSMMRELTPNMLARYTRIDYHRELALVATVQVPNPLHRGHPREDIVGFAHYLRNADGRGAEYALVIADQWQGRGLAPQLMQGLIEAALVQGLTYIDGYVLSTNRAMLRVMGRLGFQNDAVIEDPEMRRVWLDLGETRSAS